MKLISAIIKPDKLDEVIQAVTKEGTHGLTMTDVRGFGQQYGHLTGSARAGRQAVLLPKVRVEVIVLDDDAAAVAAAIAKSAQTGSIGDGKIWVVPVDSVLRVRTGERDRDAL
jgi:nitrogen regulatory protein P-II 1